MASYTPCSTCPLNPCERKKALKEQLAGAPVTAVRVRCPDYKNLFRKGQRVTVFLRAAGDVECDYGRTNVDDVKGTVIGYSNRKFLVYVDKDEQEFLHLKNESGVVKLWPSAITADDDGADPAEKLQPLIEYERGTNMGVLMTPEAHLKAYLGMSDG